MKASVIDSDVDVLIAVPSINGGGAHVESLSAPPIHAHRPPLGRDRRDRRDGQCNIVFSRALTLSPQPAPTLTYGEARGFGS